MSTRDLFDKEKPYKVLKSSDLQGITEKVESARNVESAFVRKDRFIPRIDYSDAAAFVRFGSAKKYYEDAVDRITNYYPYDGSEAEVNEYHNSSSYFDLYIFDKEYPRTTGYVTISANGWGTAGTNKSGWTATSTPEYIVARGGPHTASGGMPSGSLGLTFTGSNLYDTDAYDTQRLFQGLKTGTRESNLRYALSSGVTLEFWMDKAEFLNSSGKQEKEVIFDLWNGINNTGSADYGRLLVYLTASGPVGTGTGGTGSVRLMYASGAVTNDVEVYTSNHTTASYLGTGWHHYALSLQNSGSSILFRSYIDGQREKTATVAGTLNEVTGNLKAHIGALQTAPLGNQFTDTDDEPFDMLGYAKLSASLDDFRYWKTYRTAEDIGLNYFRTVRGGSNRDISNSDLGLYYKFNEGITTTSSTDSIVLDYSGRISNGNWVGYPGSSARNTGSALVSSSVAAFEFEDPIIRSDHPTLQSVRETLVTSGSVYDYTNNSSIFNRMPDWIIEEDTNHLEQATQIMASYLDSLHLQLEELPNLKNITYASSSNKTIPFSNRLILNQGMDAPEIFADADILAQIMGQDEKRDFELDLSEIKNRIYKNIYNNLVYIYKTKGTIRSFRNLIRCFGVGEELVKINLYGNNAEYKLRDNFEKRVSRKKYINFNHPDSFAGVVTHQSSSTNVNASNVSFVSGTVDAYIPTTSELEVLFPKKNDDRGTLTYFNTQFLSCSIFGTHRLLVDGVSNPAFEQAATANDYGWGLYAVRLEEESPDAYLVFKSHRVSSGSPDFYLTSSIIPDIYDNQRWNFAVRTKNIKYPVSNGTSGSNAGSSTDFDIDDTYLKLELYAVNYDAGILQNSIFLTSSALTASAYLTADHRHYVGAERANWTGSVNNRSDINAGSFKFWESYLENDAVNVHAKDPNNFGSLNPHRSTYLLQSALAGGSVPELETLAIHWNFENVTGSDSEGIFSVDDFSSGSTERFDRYIDNVAGTKFAKTIAYQYPAQGQFFRTNTTGVVDRAYIDGLRLMPPEALNSYDTISILNMQDDVEFTRDSRPINYYYAFEKSMYQTITEEIINFFGSIVDFNNLIGDPKNRYRQDYKDMEKLRELFFERIRNTPDLDKFIEYYKWIDKSLSVMLRNLVPASAEFSDGIRNMVESHVLERNKYWSKFPTIEMKATDPEAAVRGITELKYDWEHGHAPTVPIRAVAAEGTDILLMPGDQANNDRFKVNVPTHLGGTGEDITIRFVTATPSDGTAGEIQISLGGAETTRNRLVAAINGVDTSVVKYGAGSGDVTNGIAGISAANGSTVAKTTITSTQSSPFGGTSIIFTDIEGTAVAAGATGASPASMTVPTTALESDNCLWWKDRAERTTGALSSSAEGVNTDRESIFTVIETYRTGSPGPTLARSTKTLPTTTYQGSTYALRRFDEIYNLVPDESPLYHGGPDYSQRKRYGFITPQIRSEGSLTVIGAGSPDYGKDCDDAIIPPELDKKKVSYKFEANDASVALGGPYEDIGVGDIYSPFSVYSSSVQTGYQSTPLKSSSTRKLIDIVSGGISNLHHDIIGNDMEVPMQGPFAEKYVGGNQWRHQDLVHDPALTGSDAGAKRAEGFRFGQTAQNSLRLNAISSLNPAAVYTRDETAKRPINIRNIQMTASDIGAYKTTLPAGTGTPVGPTPTEFISGTLRSNIGNFENFYDIVQTSGRSINNVYFVDNDGVSDTGIASFAVSGVVDYTKPQRGKHEHVFVQRFSAPGGPETAGDANGGVGLDLESAEYSPYNAMPWRNSTVRTILNRTLLVNHTNQFGLYSNTQEIANRRPTNATAVDIIMNPGDQANNDRFKINVPVALGGTGVDITIRVVTATPSDGTANEIQVSLGGAETTRNRIVAAINGVDTSVVKYGAGSGDVTNGIAGVSSANGSTTAKLSVTGTNTTTATHSIVFTDIEGTMVSAGSNGSSPATLVVSTIENGSSTVTAADYSGTGSYHKVNRNTLRRPELSGSTGYAKGTAEFATVTTASSFDNYYVQHEIPASETGYAWITSSIFSARFLYGHPHPDGTYSSSFDGIIDAIEFNTSSIDVNFSAQAGYAGTPGTRLNRWRVNGTNPDASIPPENARNLTTQKLNTNIVEPMYVSASEDLGAHLGYNITLGEAQAFTSSMAPDEAGRYINYRDIGYPAQSTENRESFITSTSTGTDLYAAATVLNALLIKRNGLTGYPSWKQTRTGEHDLARLFRNNNLVTINPNPGPSLTLGDGTVVTNALGKLRTFYEPAVDKSNKSIKITLGVNTQIGVALGSGEPIYQVKPVVLETSYGNNLTRFANRELNELTTVGTNDIYTPYDSIKKTYLDGALVNPTTPVQNFVSLRYRQQVYPSSNNAGLQKIRKRENFKIKFWANSRAERSTLGLEKSSSMGAPFGGDSRTWAGNLDYLQSAWALDADENFATQTSIVTASNSTSSYAGELQAVYGQVHNGERSFITASVQYARKHMLFSTASTICPTLDNPQTGSSASSNARRQGDIPLGSGQALWEAGRLAGKIGVTTKNALDDSGNIIEIDVPTVVSRPINPIDPDYESNMKDAIVHNQEYSIIPEFRISEHLNTYFKESGGDILADNPRFLEIVGASGSKGNPFGSKPFQTQPHNSSMNNFFKTYSNSDFMKHFEAIREDHQGFKSPAKITLKCKAIKKFLPYDGFYPAQRTIDIAAQFSQSYGRFLNRQGGVDGFASTGDTFPKAAIRPFLQPFFAPGIMYNTIKSGVAVDFGTYSGSYEVVNNSGSNAGAGEIFMVGRPQSIDGKGRGTNEYASGFDNRIPFEALVNPGDYIVNTSFVDLEPHPSASMNLTSSWDGQGDPLYQMMINNFLAESINMFLPNGQMTAIISAPESQFRGFVRNEIYGMRIKMRKSLNKPRSYAVTSSATSRSGYPTPNISFNEVQIDKIRETFTMYSRPSAFGPPLAGRDFSSVNIGTIKADPMQGYNPAYTPPYYDGEAWCDVIFKARYEKHTLEEILQLSKFNHWRVDNKAWTNAGGSGGDFAKPYDRASIKHYAMQLTASINVNGKASVNSVSYRPDGTAVLVSDNAATAQDVWVIQPRFETPMFNFCSTSGSLRPITEADGNLTIPTVGKETVPRGMWHQFGLPPSTPDEGIFMEISDIPTVWSANRVPILNPNRRAGYYFNEFDGTGYKSLIDQVKFKTTSRRLGEVSESFKVSEAIVAIPYTETDGVRNFFNIPQQSLDSVTMQIENPAMAGALLSSGIPANIPGDSIKKQLETMRKYVIPPQFNFLDYPDRVDPLVMYMFEFSHVLDKEDLSHIWQNLPPKAADKVEFAEAEVSHPLLVNELMGSIDNGRAVQEELRWMVFKVKQKANINYYEKVLSRVGGDSSFKFDFTLGGETTSITDAKYSYNWPYDNFSLVEFAKIDSEVSFEDNPNVPNIDFLPEPTDDQLLNMGEIITFDGAVPSEGGTEGPETSDPTGDTGDGVDLPY